MIPVHYKVSRCDFEMGVALGFKLQKNLLGEMSKKMGGMGD